jgi:hypothetical protein
VAVQVDEGVTESNAEMVEAEREVGCQVGEEVGVRVRVAVRVTVAVAVVVFPSASESEKPPSNKLIEANATIIPKNTCSKFFISSSLEATLVRLALER